MCNPIFYIYLFSYNTLEGIQAGKRACPGVDLLHDDESTGQAFTSMPISQVNIVTLYIHISCEFVFGSIAESEDHTLWPMRMKKEALYVLLTQAV